MRNKSILRLFVLLALLGMFTYPVLVAEDDETDLLKKTGAYGTGVDLLWLMSRYQLG